MRILLIEPPFHRFMRFYRHYYPLGLAYLAGVLGQYGHVVKIYDAEHDPEAKPKSYLEATENYISYLDAIDNSEHPIWSELQREISRMQADLIGISVLTVKVPSALRIASLCRTSGRDMFVVAGGEHPTARPDDLLHSAGVDFIVRGEGELTMCELVDALCASKGVEEIDGLSFRKKGRICHNRNRSLIEDLDRLPIPSRGSLVKRETYRSVDFGLIMGSRGCAYRCTFCTNRNIWGSRARFRSVDRVIDEIRSVHEDYGTRYFSFRDYSFSINPAWTIEFCRRLMQQGPDIEWECTTRPDLMNEETIQLMKKAGCTTIRVGIESGSKRILEEIKKDLSLERVRETARILNRHKIFWSAYFMFGLPSETKEDIEKTLAFIEEVDPPFVTMSRFTPLPGSEIYQNLVKEGNIKEGSIDWRQWGNQWLQKSFTRSISEKDFQNIMQDIVKRIDEHNRRSDFLNHPLMRGT